MLTDMDRYYTFATRSLKLVFNIMSAKSIEIEKGYIHHGHIKRDNAFSLIGIAPALN